MDKPGDKMSETECGLNKAIEEEGTKNQIIEAAVKLFPQNGYERTSMKEIAQQAGVTKPAVYYYFDNKKELFKELVQIGQKHSISKIKNVVKSDQNIKDKLVDLIMSRFEFHKNNPTIEKFSRWIITSGFKYIVDIMEDQEYKIFQRKRELFTNLIKEEIEKGNVKNDIDLDILLGMVVGTMNFFAREYLLINKEKLTQEQAEKIVDIVLSGIKPK